MSRYFTRASGWIEDETFSPNPTPTPHLNVPEHESSDTGLLDAKGNRIWRAPNPMGFVWGRE